jgi:16S rRNA processing protein RimM
VLLEIGRVVKPHGVRGQVIVELSTNRPGRLHAGATLQSDLGPMEVEAAAPHGRRFIVQFTGIDDRSGAEPLRGLVLRAEPLEEAGTLWVHELIGAEVVGVDGHSHGKVEAVEANPASDLLVLEDGRLVPLTFVVANEPGRVIVDLPQGLLES